MLRSRISKRPIGAVVKAPGAKAKPPFYALRDGSCTIGSASASDLVVSDPTVSRRHASVEVVPEGITVTDLGSRNGTFYLGNRFEKITLPLGSSIRVGGVTVTFEADTVALAGMVLDEESFRGMVGTSVAMRRVFAMLARLEGSLVPVVVLGESGVGKELIARAIHEGTRADAPFIAVNCAAIPRELVTSELFGHRRGAFTGAVESRRGAFELADGGTLFLDEVGELPLEIQPVLLRALETGEIRPVGEEKTRHVNVRLVCATNRDLQAEVSAGRFREDLFFRIAVVTIEVPPLRERPEDVEVLARLFARAHGAVELPDDLIAQLRTHDWPGNARELRNAIAAYQALGEVPAKISQNRSLLDNALADLVDLGRPYADQKEELADRFTRIYLQALLARTQFNQTTAAKVAGLDRTHLGRMLARYGLSKG